MQAFEAAPWGVVVLTIPGEVRDSLRAKETHAAVRRRAVAVVVAWAQRWGFHGLPVRIGGAVVAHPCGETPEVWAPHFNVVFPWVGETDDGAFRIGKYHVDKRALDDLRQRWSVELADLGWLPTCSPQVDYEYRKNDRAKRHSARYFFRSFPTWSAWTHRICWFGFLARSIEGHDPPAWSTPTRPGRCVYCDSRDIQTLEHVSRGRWHTRDRGGPWQKQHGPPPGKWAGVWHGGSVGRAPAISAGENHGGE